MLRAGALTVLKEFFDLQEQMETPAKIPFHAYTSHFTLSSFCHTLFKYYALPEECLFLTSNQTNARRTSALELEYLAYVELCLGRKLRTAYSHGTGQHR